ncbi:MAG: AAA family ATPase [Acholeplasmatales bacterium]|jgi:AAA15 family ATPase/GTPase|nr:AAA family ATPase [Acholeplasmatales bacterium]
MNDKKDIIAQTVLLLHETANNKTASLEFESDGTMRIIKLLEILLNENSENIYLLDELDRCLHPQLTLKFVQLFLEKCGNNMNKNQLIVTSNASILLDLNVLRRDEIWFTEKKNGESIIYSLERYNERFDKKVDKAYLDGRYGGVPVFEPYLPNTQKNK